MPRNEILIYDEIGEFGVNARDVIDQLKAFGEEDVTILINSPGGDVAQGIAIYNAIKSHPGKVTVQITGVAFSMASGIAMAGDEVVAASNAVLMIHEPQAFAAGDEQEMNRKAKMLASTRDALIVAYEEKSKLGKSRIESMMREETWLTANEALELGFVDSVMGELAVAAKFELPDAIRVPARMLNHVSKVVNVDVSPEVSGTTSNQSEDAMAETKAEPKEVVESPATLDELLALNGADDSFAVAQMKVKATMRQAQDALNKILMDRLENAEQRIKDAEETAIKAAEAQAQAKDVGHDPVSDTSSDDEAGDPQETFERLLAENVSKGMTSIRAYKQIVNKHPGLIAAVRESAN